MWNAYAAAENLQIRDGLSGLLGNEKIRDAALSDALARAETGQVDADLGGGVIKQKIATARAGEVGVGTERLSFSVEVSARFLLTASRRA